MSDILTRFILDDQIMVTAADTTAVAEEARRLFGTFPVCTAALGRTLTAGLILASRLKGEDEELTVTINGGGPAGTVMVTANGALTAKGCIGNPAVDIPLKPNGKLDVGGAVGNYGRITVVRDSGAGEPYVGMTNLVSGEIAEDVAGYLLYSEQQPSIVFLSVRIDTDASVKRAGGLFITPLPGASDEALSGVESRMERINGYGGMIVEKTPSEAVAEIFSGMGIKELGSQVPRYHCDCSRERLEGVLVSIGAKDLREMIDDGKGAEICCRFCGKKYFFDTAELRALLERATDES